MAYVTASLTAENTFTDWIKPNRQLIREMTIDGFLDINISGTWSGTLTIQKKHVYGDDESAVYDIETFTGNVNKLIEDHSETVYYRIGFKTGDFTSGTATVRLDQ